MIPVARSLFRDADESFQGKGIEPFARIDLARSGLLDRGLGAVTFSQGAGDTSTVEDFSGNIWDTLADEMTFAGLRRVHNLLDGPTNSLATEAVTVKATDYIFSFTGSGTVTFSGAYSGSLVGAAGTRKAVKFTCAAGTLTCAVSGSVTSAQLERADSRVAADWADVNAPQEYVPAGEGRDSGSNVDAVEYFDYKCGNTVSAGIVTDSRGTAIDETKLRYLQVWDERTNICKASEDFLGTDWSLSGSLMQQDAGQDFALGDVLIQRIESSSATSGTHYFQHDPVGVSLSSSTVYTLSFLCKAGEQDVVGFSLADDTVGDQIRGTFNISTKAFSLSAGSAGGYREVQSGIFLVWVYCTTAAGLGSGTIMQVGVGDTSASSSIASGEGLWLSSLQVEEGMMPSPIIRTTMAAVTRGDAQLELALNNYAHIGTVICHFFMDWPPNTQAIDRSIFNIEAQNVWVDSLSLFLNTADKARFVVWNNGYRTHRGNIELSADANGQHRHRFAMAYGGIGLTDKVAGDGVALAVSVDNSATVDAPSLGELSKFRIGSSNFGGCMNGGIGLFELYRHRMTESNLVEESS